MNQHYAYAAWNQQPDVRTITDCAANPIDLLELAVERFVELGQNHRAIKVRALITEFHEVKNRCEKPMKIVSVLLILLSSAATSIRADNLDAERMKARAMLLLDSAKCGAAGGRDGVTSPAVLSSASSSDGRGERRAIAAAPSYSDFYHSNKPRFWVLLGDAEHLADSSSPCCRDDTHGSTRRWSVPSAPAAILLERRDGQLYIVKRIVVPAPVGRTPASGGAAGPGLLLGERC